MGHLGPQGPHQTLWGTQGEPPEPPRGSGSIFGTPRLLASRRPPGGLRAASRRPASRRPFPAWRRPWMACRRPLEAWRRPLEAWRRPLEAWRRPLEGLAAAAGPAAAPSFCLRFSWYASGGFFRAKNDMFRKKSDMCLEKKGAPGRLSRPRDPSRSTRAAILSRGVSNRGLRGSFVKNRRPTRPRPR